ncbi:MAG: DUF3793 family protein [Clostridiaceae bacterium]|nr:DUF3793 family protein [Clostridiaceae bacterium]
MKEEFLNFMKDLNGINYLKYHVAYFISPVLTGIKPASIMCIGNNHKRLLDLWKTHGEDFLNSINLKTILLRTTGKNEIVLIYREDKLLETLNNKENSSFLKKLGYINLNNISDTLDYLYERYNTHHCPHEIGIFLGIPLSDVEAFMNCESKQCLLCGYWKVFSNEEKAKELFRIYDWSKEMVMSHSLLGKDIGWIAHTLRNTSLTQIY